MPLFELSGSALVRLDPLAWVMEALILFVITNVLIFSRRYLAGDRKQGSHQRHVLLLAISVTTMVFANHLLLLLAAWTASNVVLSRMMVHKSEWNAARNSGRLALKTFALGAVMLSIGCYLMADEAGTASIASIAQRSHDRSTGERIALLFIIIAAMTQSAAWPMHRWLISSLNSPTTVSALMHAGLINGGGFLLVRFAARLADYAELLYGIFTIGLVTAIVGTFWKLLQTDVKRMLACSTMGQMGFMLMQFGMGLFAPAISHLCWHGLFKAYLFLSAGSVVREQRKSLAAVEVSPTRVFVATLSGCGGVWMFHWTSGVEVSIATTKCLMIALAFMAAAQLALGFLNRSFTISAVITAIAIGSGAGAIYGTSIATVETALSSIHAMQPRPMNLVYGVGILLLFAVWLGMIANLPTRLQSLAIWKSVYMSALNASQPHPSTMTATRTAYHS